MCHSISLSDIQHITTRCHSISKLDISVRCKICITTKSHSITQSDIQHITTRCLIISQSDVQHMTTRCPIISSYDSNITRQHYHNNMWLLVQCGELFYKCSIYNNIHISKSQKCFIHNFLLHVDELSETFLILMQAVLTYIAMWWFVSILTFTIIAS